MGSEMEDDTVQAEEKGERLDRWLAQRTGRSRAEIQRLIKEGRALVNGIEAKPSYLLQPRDRVEIELPPRGSLAPQPEPLPLKIVFEDEDIIVVDKPAGLVIHPAPGHPGGTLVNGLLYHCRLAETDDPRRPGIVQRLDRETSGVLIAAKTEGAYRSLVEQFKQGNVQKRYLALVHGIIAEDEGLIELPLRRDALRREEIRVSAGGKRAMTEFLVLERFASENKTLVEARPKTGRMHQLRVHFSYIGHPVVGDPKYGRRRDGAPRMMLHAWEIELHHPWTGEQVKFSAPPPAEFSAWLSGGSGGGNRAPQDRRGGSPGR
jgi:23S rRNA pseudouridine1911/1915/1917 synthase